MQSEIQADSSRIYQTITGGRIPMSALTDAERAFLTTDSGFPLNALEQFGNQPELALVVHLL